MTGLPAMAHAETDTPSVMLDSHPECSSIDAATFTGTAAHDNSPIASVEYRVDNGSWIPAVAIDGLFGDEATEQYRFITGTLADGWHSVDVKATTKAGYATPPQDYATAAFCIDTAAPTVSLAPLSPDPSADNTPALVGIAQDSTSPIAAVEYRVDGGDWVAALALDGSLDSVSENFTIATAVLADGSHTVQARASDAAGNVSATTADTFDVDSTAPALVLESVPGYINGSKVVLRGTAVDAVSAIVSVEYSADAGPWILVAASDGAFDEMEEEYAFTIADLADGWHAAAIRAMDALGNITAASEYLLSEFILDTGAPAVLLVSLCNDPCSDNTPGFSGSASDTTSPTVLVQYRIDGGHWIEAGAADGAFDELGEDVAFTTMELSDGAHSVELMAIDAAGNGSALAAHSFTIDSTVPSISVDDIPDSVVQLAHISGMAADAVPGQVGMVQVSIGRESDATWWDGSAWGSGETWLDAIGCISWSYSLPALSVGQSYLVRAISVDTAGNLSSEAQERFTVVMAGSADADPSSTPDPVYPDGETGSRNASAPWWWFLGSGLGVTALIAFILVRKARKGSI